MKKRYYILIGILSYLIFTLGNIPAAKVISLIEKNYPLPAKLHGVYGSLWDGGAEKAIIAGQPSVDNLQWSLNPASLLLASLSGELKASVNQQNVIGNIRIGPTGNISASDVRARIEASIMQELIQLPLGELGGVFNINIESLELTPQSIPNVTAQINWKSAKLTLLETVDLGNIELSVEPGEANQLVAKIKNNKGQLSLNGNANIDDKKMYAIDLSIKTEDNTSDNIKQSLKMFARRQTDGSYLLKRKGNLQEFGF